jgi:Carboxypeptidase regulatory-like domain
MEAVRETSLFEVNTMIRLSLQRSLTILGLLAALTSQISFASAGTLGGINGVVKDAKTGAPIAGVHLKISSPSQTVNVTTDAKGHYVVFSLQPDDYTLTAEKAGYATRTFTDYSVYADQTQQYDLQLDPGNSEPDNG